MPQAQISGPVLRRRTLSVRAGLALGRVVHDAAGRSYVPFSRCSTVQSRVTIWSEFLAVDGRLLGVWQWAPDLAAWERRIEDVVSESGLPAILLSGVEEGGGRRGGVAFGDDLVKQHSTHRGVIHPILRVDLFLFSFLRLGELTNTADLNPRVET